MRRLGAVLCATMLCLGMAAWPVSAAPTQPARQVLYARGSFYPRVIRLANGMLLTSLTTNIGRDGVGVIEASVDDGQSFQQVAQIRDPTAAAGGSVCCATLFQLPSRVGDLPAGTVLWAASTGSGVPASKRTSRERLWASSDDGLSWRFVSD